MESPFRADLLRGKAALVTGGGSGIGFEIATQLARHGAHVALMGRRREVLDKAVAALRSEGLKVRTYPITRRLPLYLPIYHCRAYFPWLSSSVWVGVGAWGVAFLLPSSASSKMTIG
jgi:hypothetical protein